MAKKGELTPEEERFVEEYLIDRHGTAAYIRAFPGTKRPTACELASRMLRKVKIAAAVKAGERDLQRRSRVKAVKVVEHAARIAFLDIGEVFDLGSNEFVPLPPRQIPQDIRRAIQAVKVTRRRLKSGGDEDYEVETVEYKLPDKNAALDKLFRHLGLYKDLPLLEVLLGGLPPEVAATVRAALAAQVDSGRGASGSSAARVLDPGPTPGGPSGSDAGGGPGAGPVAGGATPVPGPADRGPLHPPVGEDADGGGASGGPLLDP